MKIMRKILFPLKCIAAVLLSPLLLAAVELRRNFYGFEINKEFYRRAKEEMLRLPEEAQMSLFDVKHS